MRAKKIYELIENVGGAGGAGYAVWGGGWGRNFGNPTTNFMGRGFGFGGSQNLSGGPNLMYTYSVKPLGQELQPPPSDVVDDSDIHVGCLIKGTIFGTDDERTEGRVLHIERDNDNNIKWFLILDVEDGKKKKIDPTSSYEVIPSEEDDSWMEIEDEEVRESFYPNLVDNF